MVYIYKVGAALAVPLLILAAFVIALYVFQDKLLYHPVKAGADNYAPDGLELWPGELQRADTETRAQSNTPEHSSAKEILGLFTAAVTGIPDSGTAIVFHGNAGHAGHRSYYAQQLTALGMRVILAEYPGYGPRSGKPNESVIVDDALNTVALAHELYGQPIWVFGESLGAGVAAAVAGRMPTMVQGVVLITPWNRLLDLAEHHYPFLPVQRLLSSEYDSIQSLSTFDGPKLVIVADADNIIPAPLGINLYETLQGSKRLIVLEDAGHNDWTQKISSDTWADIIQWLRKEQSLR